MFELATRDKLRPSTLPATPIVVFNLDARKPTSLRGAMQGLRAAGISNAQAKDVIHDFMEAGLVAATIAVPTGRTVDYDIYVISDSAGLLAPKQADTAFTGLIEAEGVNFLVRGDGTTVPFSRWKKRLFGIDEIFVRGVS